MTVPARLMREERVALFIAEVGNVYDGNRVGGNELQRLAGFEADELLAGLEHGQRTKEAYGIEFMFHGPTI